MRIALAIVALCLPGLAWWLWLGDHEQDGGEALARIFAVSASFISLVALAFYTIRIAFTPMIIGVLLSLCIGLVLAGLIHSWKTAFSKTWLIALLVLAIFVIWRLWQARELVFPNWVDSQHHVLIIRKIIENGGLPSTLEPYLPGPFYYHFAFHAVTAFFSVLSGLAPEQAVLILGQVLNACVGISVYALAKAVGRDWRVGLLAAFFVTFVTKMPGYYLTWGRYTLLMGVMILPVAMAEVDVLRRGAAKWSRTIGLFLLTVGTLLSHYLAAFLLAVYFLIVGFDWVIESIKKKKADWLAILTLAAPAFIGLLASIRWYIRVFRYSAAFVNTKVNLPEGGLNFNPTQLDYLRYILGPEVAYSLLGLAVFGIIWALIKDKWRGFGAWSLSTFFFTLPIGIQIFSFRSDYYGLILFIPLAILCAGLLVWVFDFLTDKVNIKKTYSIGMLVLMLAFVGWGVWSNTDAVNEETILVNKSDLAAFDWLKDHTPVDAHFFVNTTAWGYGLYRGTDGGGWLLPTTGRWSLAPTIFYPFGADEETSAKWTDWATRASKVESCEQDFWELVEEAELGYVYIRDGSGSLHSQNLLTCDRLRKLYDNEGVSIWLIQENNDEQ